jgi:hypothetical protein
MCAEMMQFASVDPSNTKSAVNGSLALQIDFRTWHMETIIVGPFMRQRWLNASRMCINLFATCVMQGGRLDSV